ncbi:MAG TPA: hypothetical protein VK928_06710 [Longimicrobiales bacterium]|nr:hypothetical protein [Longimicrobiales bacterium]
MDYRQVLQRAGGSMLLVLMAVGVSVSTASSQVTPAQPPVVDVFLDCQTHGCDSQHFRNEIGFVNWVRDRTVADVHVLITSQSAGGGGTVYQLSFFGLRGFATDSATLRLSIPQGRTDAERRDLLTNRLAQGLVAYAAGSGAADRIRIVFDAANADDANAPTASTEDPWNSWVFSTFLDASMEGQSGEKSQELELGADASRITADWKFEIELEGSHQEETFELKDGERTFVTRNWQVDGLLTKSLAAHWSAGLAMEAGRSTFNNQLFYARPAVALEYSLFPYDEYSRRRVLMLYTLGARYSDYEETTIYGQDEELRYDESLQLTTEFRQPWGSARLTLSGSHYLHNINRYRLSANTGIDVRLFRGFSLGFNANYSRVHDQLNIPAGDADDEEILLRRRALATNYRYGTSIRLRYTFGSVYNNIVNPRIGGTNRF